MNKTSVHIVVVILAIWTTGCDLALDVPEPQPGNVDWSNYLAVGGAQTAGFTNDGLYRDAQQNSFPALLATQLKEVEGGDFQQPLLPEGNGTGYQYLAGFNSRGIPVIKKYEADPAFPAKASGDFDNLGIPGMRIKDITTSGYGALNPSGNPYFYRLLDAGEENKSYLELIAEQQPTFFTCLAGMDDVLRYAATGGIYDADDPEYGITAPSEFETKYRALLDALGPEASGVVINLPDIFALPYFTTFSRPLVELTDQSLVDQLNEGYGLYNSLVGIWNSSHPNEQYDSIFWHLGSNSPVVYDETVPPNLLHRRQLREGEYLLLSIPPDSLKPTFEGGAGWGTQNPVPAQHNLLDWEVQPAREALQAYNNIIQGEAAARDRVILFDARSFYNNFITGKLNDSETVSLDFISGGLISLDGIHLTPKGNAYLANGIIELLNQQFDATIPPLITSRYEGNVL